LYDKIRLEYIQIPSLYTDIDTVGVDATCCPSPVSASSSIDVGDEKIISFINFIASIRTSDAESATEHAIIPSISSFSLYVSFDTDADADDEKFFDQALGIPYEDVEEEEEEDAHIRQMIRHKARILGELS
jgi:hypothetical protein